MNGTQVDARRRPAFGKVRGVHSEMPVECRQTPAMGMVDPQIPEQAGAALHALHELVRHLSTSLSDRPATRRPSTVNEILVGDLPRLQLMGLRCEGQRAQKC